MVKANTIFTWELWQRQLVRFAPHIVIGALLIVMPPFLPAYYQVVMTRIVIFALFAMSLDVIFGYTGLLSLGHAAYFGAAGYTTGILVTRYGVESLWVGAPLGILAAVCVAAIFGIIALRVSGLYFLLVTFALGQLLVNAAIKWDFLSTNPKATEGIMRISRPDLGLPGFTWDTTSFYYFVFLASVICFFLLYRLINSPFGYVLQGIRENELRMRALGYNTWLHKYLAFVAAGAFAGVAGVLLAYKNGFMVPSAFGVSNSALAFLIVIIGGGGTLYGSFVGATIIILVETVASTLVPERWPLILGSTFVLAVMYARGGIGVHLTRSINRWLAKWKH